MARYGAQCNTGPATANRMLDHISQAKRKQKWNSNKFRRSPPIQAINAGLVMTYWQIGQHMVEFEQRGHTNAEYGQKLLAILSHDLKLKHGKGFSVSNLQRFRQFYSLNPNCATLSHNLSWSHHVELLKISNKSERSFCTKQAQAANWSVRELSAHAIADVGKMIELAPSGAATRSPSWSVAECEANPIRETVSLELSLSHHKQWLK